MLYPRSPMPHCSTDEEEPGGRSPPFEVSEGEEDTDRHPSTSSALIGEFWQKTVFFFLNEAKRILTVPSRGHFKITVNFYRKQKESAPLSVPLGPSSRRRHAGLHLVGGQRKRHLSVLLQTQGDSRQPMGPTEGQPQDDDLSEDGPGSEELRQDRRGQKGEEETDVSVQQWRDEENGDGEETVSSLRLISLWTWFMLQILPAIYSKIRSCYVDLFLWILTQGFHILKNVCRCAFIGKRQANKCSVISWELN